MRRLLPAALVLVVACSGPTAVVTTIAPHTTLTLAPTTTAAPMPIEIQDCDAPAVTFSTLCETVELLSKWYVDRPVDLESLSKIATEAVMDFTTEEVADPPRIFFCALPDVSFVKLCDALADRVENEHLPVGPAMEAAVVAMIDLGLDPFTWYIPPELSKGLRGDGIVGGIGVLLDATDAAGSKCTRITETCPLRIVFVIEDNPGSQAGLMPGDIITAVDGESVDGRGFVDTATRIGRDETGTVELSIIREGEIIEFSIQRSELEQPSLEVEFPVAGTAYLRIPDFGWTIPVFVNTALSSLLAGSPDTIVVDLRDNPGGLVDAVVAVASEFIPDGVVMEASDHIEDFTYSAVGNAQAPTERLIVLVNEGTASAAEILAGALRDRRGAIVIGQPTFGKNAVQIPFDLRNGGEFHVAIARWTTPNGTSVANGGLIPDRVVEFPMDPTAEELVNFAIEAS